MKLAEFFRIGVFWNVRDCQIPDDCDPRMLQIPDDCDPRMLYESIESHLKRFGYRGEISFWAYKDANMIIPDELKRRFSNAGIMFKPDGDRHARVKKMLVDILLLANEARPVNFLVLSANYGTDTVLASVIEALVSRKFVALTGDIEFYQPTWTSNWPLKIDKYSKRIVNTSVGRGNDLVTGCGIFWDLMDYPIPTDLDAESVYLTIGTALCNKGFLGDVSIWAYGDMQTFPEDTDPDSRFRIGFVPEGGDYSRGFKMLLDMLFWALDNPKDNDDEFPTLLVLSEDITQEVDFARVVNSLESRYYDVCIPEPGSLPEGVSVSSNSSAWLLTCLLEHDQEEEPRKLTKIKRERTW